MCKSIISQSLYNICYIFTRKAWDDQMSLTENWLQIQSIATGKKKNIRNKTKSHRTSTIKLLLLFIWIYQPSSSNGLLIIPSLSGKIVFKYLQSQELPWPRALGQVFVPVIVDSGDLRQLVPGAEHYCHSLLALSELEASACSLVQDVLRGKTLGKASQTWHRELQQFISCIIHLYR